MIYKFLRWYAKCGIKFFYKNVFIQNKTKIDYNTPTMFSSNHPAGFYESIILTTIIKKPVYFLVRSDYVNIPILKWFFDIIKLLPIYRQSEGFNNVKKNNEVFSEIYKNLKTNAFIGIYPEGTTKYQFNLNPIKKGVSRIGVGALKNGINNLKIIPTGFNFSQPDKFRSYLNIYLGEAISLTPDIMENKKENAIIRELNSYINTKMHDVNIIITEKRKQHVFAKLQILLINNELICCKHKIYETNSSIPENLKSYSQLIEKMNENQFIKLENNVNNYFSLLTKENITDFSLVKNNVTIFNTISLILGFPLFITGIILNFLPVLPAILIVKKYTKVYEYKAVLKVLISQFFYALYYLIINILGFLYLKTVGVVFISLPLTAWYSLKYYDLSIDYINSYRYNNSDKKVKIQELRNKIMTSIS